MLTYQEALNLFSKAHDKTKGYKLPGRLGQTRLIQTDFGFAIKYINTIVVEFNIHGEYVLNTSGNKTKTTKARMNEYSPAHVFQRGRQWYVKLNGVTVEFVDGIRVTKSKIIIPKQSRVERLVEFCNEHDIEFTAFGLAPNPFGFTYECGEGTAFADREYVELILNSLNKEEEEELKKRVLG